jgi:predicted nucleotidyltransferase
LVDTSLDVTERQALHDLVNELQQSLGSQLRSVWLYGSRARGEPPHSESDVDLLVVLARDSKTARKRVYDAIWNTTERLGISPMLFSAVVYDVERVAQRRAIGSFFIHEVDRDKVVLYGEP